MNMKYSLFALALSVLFGCQPKKQEAVVEADSVETSAAEPTNTSGLTEAQKAEGWTPLFDGNSTTGWKFFKGKENDSWEVQNGVLHCKPFDSANKRADLMTVDEFDNFELAFDWKVSPQANSGIMFRVTEEFDEPYKTGPEYQVIDDEGYPGDLKDVHFTGGVYDMYVPTTKPVNPIGEWNSSRLIANKNHIEHWLNGIKVVDYELTSKDWKKRKDGGKWKDEPKYGMVTKGHIDIQDHGSEVWFRNILIKKL